MRTIYKYALAYDDEQVLYLHRGASILTVQNQREELVLWADVDTSNDKVMRKIRILFTGFEIPSYLVLSFISTVQLSNGLVAHIFEEI